MKKLIFVFLLFVLTITNVFATNESVDIVIPDFAVTLNGTVVDNTTEKYPFIVYKGITYMPMTWDLSYALGLELKWDANIGLMVSKRDEMKVYVQNEKVYNVIGETYRAEVVSFPVQVNGKKVDNVTAEYPLLNFRNITYFPMTYDYMVNEFASGYKWDNETGLKVAADERLKIYIPEPYTVILKVDHKTIANEIIMSEQMIKVELEDDYEYVAVVKGMNHKYDGYYYNLYVNHYDKNDKLIYKEILNGGNIYESNDESMGTEALTGLQTDSMIPEAYYIVEVELLPLPIARAEFHEDYKNVLFDYFIEEDLSYSDINIPNAAYFDAELLSGTYRSLPDDLVPFAAVKSTRYKSNDDLEYEFEVFITDEGEVKFESFTKSLTPIKSVDKIGIKPNTMNFGLKCFKGNLSVADLHKGCIKIYDKDFNLIKILINKNQVDRAKGL